MSDDVYEQLAEALDDLPNGFPRTPSNVEIAILKRIFSLEEAALASQLHRDVEPIGEIAERVGRSVEEVGARLMGMNERGLVWYDERDGKPCYRLAPFVVGIYEAQLNNMDHEFAHLVERYFTDGGAVGIMGPQPALHRVIPAQRAVKAEQILPYDDVRAILLTAKAFRLNDCICRAHQEKLGRRCSFPLKMCFSFSQADLPPSEDAITQEEALSVLEKAEEIGLVHTVNNVAKGMGYVCNCCGCCCGILRGINDWGIGNSVAHANYYAVIDQDECLGCGTCVGRCQVHAVSEREGIAFVDKERCIGCGLCVTGCPHDVARLQRKPDAEVVDPPADFATWELKRLRNRGLIE
jgi:electron transport complex protein RnfB